MYRILPDTYKEETYCYEKRNTNWTDYHLVPDLPRTVPPLDHRPRWKGVGKTPNTAHTTLIEEPPRDRARFEGNGFIPHTGEFKHFKDAINQESSLRNLDLRLTNRAFGRRVIQEISNDSYPTIQDKPYYHPAEANTLITPGCSFDRKFDQDYDMNSARFNNSTRATTRNLRLPLTRKASRAAIPKGRPGFANTNF